MATSLPEGHRPGITTGSHRGIVGICRHAVRVTGVPRVHAVVGGFHLSGLPEEQVARVGDAFRELGVEKVFTLVVGPNEASRRALERVGSRQCGTWRRHWVVDGGGTTPGSVRS
jgi:metal-dependent hydrolase (beta-lactamase superfamily II)